MAPLRVLFLMTERLTADIRIAPLLDALSASGHISYACVDRNMAISGVVSHRYDVLLTHRAPSSRQFAWLRRRALPPVYDIDDLLLQQESVPSGRRQAAAQEAVAWCLQRAHAVMAPSRRLLATLEQRLDEGLGSRAVYFPNAGLETPPPPKIKERPRLLWVSSAQPMAGAALDEICRGIDDAARALGTDIVLVGRFPAGVRDCFHAHQAIAWLDPQAYLDFLAEGPFIAVAPLSMDLDPALQMFADCKSDIKIAQFGASRIAGVYSSAPPFAESDLPRHCVAGVSRSDWTQAILQEGENFPQAGNALAEHPAFARRRPSILAQQLFDILAQAAAATEPFSFWAIPTPDIGNRIERGFRQWRSRLRP